MGEGGGGERGKGGGYIYRLVLVNIERISELKKAKGTETRFIKESLEFFQAVCLFAHEHMYTHTCMHIRAPHTHTHVHTHVQTLTHTHTHTNTHIQTHTYKHTHTCEYACARTHTDVACLVRKNETDRECVCRDRQRVCVQRGCGGVREIDIYRECVCVCVCVCVFETRS